MPANFPEASLDVQPLSLSVFCPLLFQCTGLLLRRDPELGQRQNQRECSFVNTRFHFLPILPSSPHLHSLISMFCSATFALISGL
jgi:hypothetical protein